MEEYKCYIMEELRLGNTVKGVSSEIGVTRETVHRWLKKWGVNQQRMKFDHDFFESIDSEHKAYWLGFIMADGCVSITQKPKVVLKLAVKDELHLKKWHDSIRSNRKLCKGDWGVASTHFSKKMCNDLANLGCIPKKSLCLKFPDIEDSLVHHFVRGYFDGDGCADQRKHQKKPQLRLTFIGTENFLSELQKHIGITNKLQPVGNNKINRSLSVCGNIKAKRIADWMYKDATVFLERKREVCFALL